MKERSGVCCFCQSAHPVRPSRLTLDELEELEDQGHGEETDWVMDKHMIFGDSGPWCEGEGSMPQAVVVVET